MKAKRDAEFKSKNGLMFLWTVQDAHHYELKVGQGIVAWVSYYGIDHKDVMDRTFEPGWHWFANAEDETQGPFGMWQEAAQLCERWLWKHVLSTEVVN